MNGRTFYAVEAGGSRVVPAASPRLTPLGLYGHRTTCRPSRPAVRPRATLARRCGRRKRNAVRRTAASRTTRPLPDRGPTAYAVGLIRASHRMPSKPTGRKAAGDPRKTLGLTTRNRASGSTASRHKQLPPPGRRLRRKFIRFSSGSASRRRINSMSCRSLSASSASSVALRPRACFPLLGFRLARGYSFPRFRGFAPMKSIGDASRRMAFMNFPSKGHQVD